MRPSRVLGLAAVMWSVYVSAQESYKPAGPREASHPIAPPEMTKALPDCPGKEAMFAIIEHPAPLQHSDADVFICVLEGSLVMGVKGSPVVNLSPGQSWYEGPQGVHTVGRNASQTEPAKFVDFFLRNPVTLQ